MVIIDESKAWWELHEATMNVIDLQNKEIQIREELCKVLQQRIDAEKVVREKEKALEETKQKIKEYTA